MGQYSKKGMYSGYDKNHKERDKKDYYSTPIEEVFNILDKIGFKFVDTDVILEPSCGSGHMVEGIIRYCKENGFIPNIIATDIQEREIKANIEGASLLMGREYDFIEDSYPYIDNIDYIIMNPPFSLIEPFVMKSLEIAKKGILMFGRLQFLEGEKRYEHILKDNPPTIFYTYVDRVACFKDGNTAIKPSSIQAYAWFYWDKQKDNKTTIADWIRRIGK